MNFLDSIYMCQNMIFIFLFLTYFTLCNRLYVDLPHIQLTQMYAFSWLIFYCVYVPQLLYPFIYQWTSRLFPLSSYCKYCFSEHWDTCIFFNFDFLRVYDQEWDCWVIWWFYSQFLNKSPYHLPQWLYQFTFPPTVQEHSLFSTPSPAFIVCRLFDDGHSDWCEVIPHCSFDLYFSNNQ